MAGSSHGHTPAAWTGVTIAIIGFTVAGAFMVMAEPLGFWAGMAIVALAGVVGMAMRAAGLGQPRTAHPVHRVAATPAATATREPASVEG
ncbi:HGxxPAAW family protein [Streptomyces sp. NPDC002623]|uniref:HGxxPAAW family protein n=1 Tax=unclassified Streptomyces TaxID=2593676 RepID=UPI0033320D01